MSRVLLIEDHVSFRQALAVMLSMEPDFEVVGQAGSVEEAGSVLGVQADIAVVDLGLPDGDGVELIRELRLLNPTAKILVLTASIDQDHIACAVEAGAAGIVDKTASVGEVMDAMKRLLAGEVLLPPEEVVELLRLAMRERERRHQEQMAIMKLTRREIEVLEALADGLNSEEIAKRLCMTVETERTHIVNILKKLKVHSRLEAVVFAVRHGLVEIRPKSPSYY